ncbi:MAG: signal recognition particle-docking protein FtsY [Nanoarchaeota archaeon]
MFGKLKEKLKNWAKNLTEEKEKQEETVGKPKKIKEERKREKEKIKKTSEEVKEERKISDHIIEEIKKERGDDVRPIPRPEEIEEEIKKIEVEEERKSGFFSRITSKIIKVKISEKEFEAYSDELEMLLLENNVALEVTEKIIKELKEKIVGRDMLKKDIESEIKKSFREIIEKILIEPFDILKKINEKKEPFVILFCGINGTGKTTTIAKIADFLKKNKVSCVMAAGDTFRAASIEQIKKHGERLKIKVIASDYGADPASVGFDAINYAKKNHIKCVLIDTAGRMHTAKNLLREMEKIVKICKPDINVFIGESITGNDAIEQVRGFDEHVGIDGIILTKADIDEKGGTALSLGYVTKKPILYLGTGQEYDAIEPFDKRKFIERLGL